MTATVTGAETPDATGSPEATGSTGATGSPEVTTSPSATGSPSPTGATGATGADSDIEGEVEDFVRSFIDDANEGDAEAMFDKMTDEAVEEFLGGFGMDTTDLEAAKAEAAEFFDGDDESDLEVEEVTVTNATATSATAEVIGSSAGVKEGDVVEVTRVGDEWKVSSLQFYAVSPEIPSDYTTLTLGLQEFAFDLEEEVPTGKVAFTLENNGEQPHEAILAKLDEDLDLQAALESESEDEPEGVETIGGVFGIEPGATYNMVLTDDLEAGRYAFVCFFPDLTEGEEGTPHALKGMVLEFNIE